MLRQFLVVDVTARAADQADAAAFGKSGFFAGESKEEASRLALAAWYPEIAETLFSSVSGISSFAFCGDEDDGPFVEWNGVVMYIADIREFVDLGLVDLDGPENVVAQFADLGMDQRLHQVSEFWKLPKLRIDAIRQVVERETARTAR